MPKVIPVPDKLSQPFWDGVNGERVLLAGTYWLGFTAVELTCK